MCPDCFLENFLILLGRDVLAKANPGTGKTATALIGALQLLDLSIKDCQALILTPFGEAAQQVNIHLTYIDYMF
jgi:superfamily II DNA/RNA helicase